MTKNLIDKVLDLAKTTGTQGAQSPQGTQSTSGAQSTSAKSTGVIKEFWDNKTGRPYTHENIFQGIINHTQFPAAYDPNNSDPSLNLSFPGAKKWSAPEGSGYYYWKPTAVKGNDIVISEQLPKLLASRGLKFRITSNYRSPNDPLSKANPRSQHIGGHAIDIAPEGGLTFADLSSALLTDRTIINFMLSNNLGFLDESTKAKMTAWATGAHFHIGRDHTLSAKYKKMFG